MNYTLTGLFGRPYMAVDNWIKALTDGFAGVPSIAPINLTLLLVLLIFTIVLLLLFVKRVST